MTHVKTLASPKALKVHRKERAFIMKPSPGAHKSDEAVPIGVLFRDYMGIAENRKEVRHILKETKVLVNGRRVKDEKFPVGLLDIIELKQSKKVYLLLVDSKARIEPKELKDAGEKIARIIGKTAIKGGRIQLNLYGGSNILISSKESKKYPVGASVFVSLEDFKIKDVVPREKGKMALVAKGRHAGKVGKISEITKSGLNLKSLTTIESDGENVVTNTEYIFIVGDKEAKI